SRLAEIADPVASFSYGASGGEGASPAPGPRPRAVLDAITAAFGVALPMGKTPASFSSAFAQAIDHEVVGADDGGYEVRMVGGGADYGDTPAIGGRKLLAYVAETYLDEAQKLLVDYQRPLRIAPDFESITDRRLRRERAGERFLTVAKTPGGPISAQLFQAIRNFEAEGEGVKRALGFDLLDDVQCADLRDLDIGELAEARAALERFDGYVRCLRDLVNDFTTDTAADRGFGPIRLRQSFYSLAENVSQFERALDLAEFGPRDRESRRFSLCADDDVGRFCGLWSQDEGPGP
ncbi:MAG: hypothetical protein AAF360_13415, partial [Pseudomonadota bacterium]